MTCKRVFTVFWFIILIANIFLPKMITTNLFAASIKGKIIDPLGHPISGSHVFINQNRVDVTDDGGNFLLEEITLDSISVCFDHIGFERVCLGTKNITLNDTMDLGVIQLEYATIDMQSVVVTATRSQRLKKNVPQSTNVISDQEIMAHFAKTSAEALRGQVGISVQKTNHGGGSAIIRGLSSNQILILVDGIRLNNSLYRLGNHQYLTTVDALALERIEVVRGPSSVLYGSDALGGTLNLMTRYPDWDDKPLGIRIFSRYASADHEKTNRAELTYHMHDLAIQLGMSYKDYDDLRRGERGNDDVLDKSKHGSKQHPSGFNGYDIDSKLVWQISHRQSLTLAYQYARQFNVPRYDKYENNDYFRWVYEPQKRNLAYILYNLQLNNSLLQSLRITTSIHHQQEGREIQKSKSLPFTRENDRVRTLGLSLQLENTWQRHRVIAGTEIYLDDVQSKRWLYDAESRVCSAESGRYPDNAEYNSLGLYLQDEINVGPNLNVLGGLRWSRFFTQFTRQSAYFDNVEQVFQAITANAGCTYALEKGIQLYTNLSQGFRAPNLSDISKVGESKGTIYEIPNPDLKPEKLLNLEFGTRFDTNTWFGEFAFYHSQITSLVASAPARFRDASVLERNGILYAIKTKKNIGKAFIRGVESFLNLKLNSSWLFSLNLTWTYGQNKTLDEPVGGIPPLFGVLGIKWQRNQMYFEFVTRFATEQDRLSSDDLDDPRIPNSGTPEWIIFNLSSGFKLTDFIQTRAGIENVLDLNYRVHGSGINGPGRNFIISIDYQY